MKLILNPSNLIDILQNEGIEAVPRPELQKLEDELRDLGENISLEETNLGGGADWIVILAIINSIANVFLVGDKILKGIEGWVKIGKKLKSLIVKKEIAYIDEDAASILAIEYISSKEQIRSLEKISRSETPLIDLSGAFNDRKSEDFIAKPQTYFLQKYKINDESIYVIGIKSDGRIKEIEKFNLNDLNVLGYEDKEI